MAARGVTSAERYRVADQARRAPRSVPDPDREAYDRSVRENAALQAERERREAGHSSWRDKAADVAGDVLTVGQGALETTKKYARDPRIVRGATRISGYFNPAAHMVAGYEARRQYGTDVARGMPRDEALVRAAGDLAGGEIGGALGAAGGAAAGGVVFGKVHPDMAPVGAFGGAVFGAGLGGEKGREVGRRIVEPYRDAKENLTRELRPLYDPRELYNRMKYPY